MTGLKSGSGDDLWGDDTDDESEKETETTEVDSTANDSQQQSDVISNTTTEFRSRSKAREGRSPTQQPYIVRRAIQDKSIQFERDERLTFFVHDDVIEGERQLLTEVETALGRDVPKFDVREAVYRAALRNREDVLDELIEMGYSSSSE
ncbi:hypothetical protein [Halalkalicoccus salilacus]|uniref:hypothetical protein n=1 Tax=Halalkalicoccus salilacus TaxID=3117459 RepID=UPI00300EBADF